MDVAKLQIKQNEKIIKALEIINESGLKVVFVVNDKGALIGSVTDGDVRRGLLNGTTIEDSIDKVMNATPHFVYKSELENYKFIDGIEFLPVLNDENCIVDLIQQTNTFAFEKSNNIIVMAGGLGSRLGDLTKDTPKPMLKVGKKPILERVISQIHSAGFKNFTLAVNYKSEVIKEYFGNGDKLNVSIDYLEEKKKLGTAGALSLFTPKNNEPIIITNGDVLTDINFSKLLAWHNANEYDITICSRVYSHRVPFGTLETKDGLLEQIKEKPLLNFDVAAGIYVINSNVIDLVKKDEYLDMPSLLELAKGKNNKIGMYKINNYWIDVGRINDLEKARLDHEHD